MQPSGMQATNPLLQLNKFHHIGVGLIHDGSIRLTTAKDNYETNHTSENIGWRDGLRIGD